MRALRVLAVAAVLGVAPTPARAKPGAVPAEFGDEARLFYRIVACAGNDAVEAKLEKIVAAHCQAMAASIAKFRERFVDPATAFFAKVRPSGLPTTVVYPFGGGDLVSALITFPDATELTTMSLEHAGDPTRLGKLTPNQLKKYLARFRDVIRGLLANSDSESVKLKLLERGPIPGQLAFHITGLAIMGYQPVGLRYFQLAEDGTVVHYTRADLDDLAGKRAKKKKGSWVDTDWSVAYSNMELRFQQAGDASAPVLTHRHLAANLEDKAFVGSGLQKHLEAKGKVAMLTKAASYLMWMNSFSAIRDYVATHLVWMASDTTGLPPRWAKQAGLEQTTYGKFAGTLFGTNRTDRTAFVKLWKQQPYRKIAFRYGYRDSNDAKHLLITQPSAKAP